MASSGDIEAGKAYVTLYLRRLGFDAQVDSARQQMADLSDNLATEAKPVSIPVQLDAASAESDINIDRIQRGIAVGIGGQIGQKLVTKFLPMFSDIAKVAVTTVPAVAAVGTAATGAATATAAMGVSAGAAAPAVAATGVAATGASGGFMAMTAAALPILIPLAAIAAAAGLVYVTLFKWDELPIVVKALLIVFSPLVIILRAAVLAFKAVKLAVDIVLAPFRLAAGAVGMLHRAIVALPGACLAAGGAVIRMGQRIGSAVVAGVAAASAALVKLPGRLASFGASVAAATSRAISAVGGAMQTTGKWVAIAGGAVAGLAGAIVTPLTAAANEFAKYGQEVADVSSEYGVSSEDAAMLMRAATGTGQSIKELAGQLADGSRDFTRWREEARAAGLVLDGPGVGAALALTQAYQALKASLAGLRVQLGSAVAPLITETTTLMVAAIRAVTSWVVSNKPLIAQIFAIASRVAMAGAAIATLGGVLVSVGTAITPWATALAGIAAALALVEMRTDTGRGLWESYGDSVRRVYGVVVQYLGQMTAFVSRVMGGVMDAVRGGDLGLAVRVLWAGAKVAWITGLMELDKLTGEAFGGILKNLAAGNWTAAATSAWLQIQIAFQQGMLGLSSIWSTLRTSATDAWGWVVDAADRAWVSILNAADPVWLAMRGHFQNLLTWGKSTFDDIAEFVSIFVTVLASVAKPLKAIITALALLNPIAASAFLAAGSALKEVAAAATSTAAVVAKQAARGVRKLQSGEGLDDPVRAKELADRKAAREKELADRIAARRRAGDEAGAQRLIADDAARLAREQEIERLRKKQAELAKAGGDDNRQAENESKLAAALAAAAAARKEAEKKQPNDKDFAKIDTSKADDKKAGGMVRFSGEALSMAFAAQQDPQKEQVKTLREMLTVLNAMGIYSKENLQLMRDGFLNIGFG